MTISFQTGDDTCRCSYLAPSVSYTTIHSARKSVECMDVTTGGIGVSCDTEGKLKIWTTNNGEIRVGDKKLLSCPNVQFGRLSCN